MALKRLDHVSLIAHDPLPVISFYERFLGFEVAARREISEMKMTIIELRARGDYIEVLQPMTDKPTTSDGIKHIAFESDDIDGDFEALKAQGAPLIHQAVQRHENVSFFFLKAPTGELVEVIHYS